MIVPPRVRVHAWLPPRTVSTTRSGLAGPASQEPAARRGIKLGFDHFSVRDLGLKAPALIDYAGALGVDALLLSELNVFEQRDDDLAEGAEGQGGCGRSSRSTSAWAASARPRALSMRRPALRPTNCATPSGSRTASDPRSFAAILGRFDDRLKDGGIEAHIKNTVEVCKAVRDEALKHQVRIAVENHAGDMQAWELAGLVEAAGPDYVGVNLDPGNATWTMEDPIASLETLASYVACTSIRDSAIWSSPEGAVVQWTAMGDGDVDFRRWTDIFATRTKGVPVFIETISGLQRPFPVLSPDFWKAWPKARAQDLARWLAIAGRGKPRQAFKAPEGPERRAAVQAYQKAELEKSLTYCRTILGLGVRG